MSVTVKSWEDFTPLEQAQCTYWDMYKDAYGVRPRGVDTSTWTLADFETEFQVLSNAIERENAQQQVSQEKSAHELELRIQNLMMTGAKNRDMAISWIMQAEGADGDFDYLCFLVGVPYGYFKKVA
jgi:hypothetical protein